jgi:hypothetical protein
MPMTISEKINPSTNIPSIISYLYTEKTAGKPAVCTSTT